MLALAPFGIRLAPPVASTMAPRIDAITIGLLVFSGIMLLVVFGLLTVFAAGYRQGAPRNRRLSQRGQSLLEWGWTSATFVVFAGFFVWGTIEYLRLHLPPPGALEISVVGKQWMWKFQHPDGHRELDELHVPTGRPVLLTMTSQDVIHSFFVPAFRLKQDVVPGRYEHAWFEATTPGEYHLFCTQYCGTMHAEMRGKIIVQAPEDYERWLRSGVGSSMGGDLLSMAARGRALFTARGCVSCHGGGTQPGGLAPRLEGIFGKDEALSTGRTVRVDENYLRESIVNPRAKIVKGYQPIMPSFAGQLSEEELLELIAYIRSLGGAP